jgi:hypothetical protein
VRRLDVEPARFHIDDDHAASSTGHMRIHPRRARRELIFDSTLHAGHEGAAHP